MAVNGTVRFADPLTWTLTDFPTVTPCSDLTPTRWKIHKHLVLRHAAPARVRGTRSAQPVRSLVPVSGGLHGGHGEEPVLAVPAGQSTASSSSPRCQIPRPGRVRQQCGSQPQGGGRADEAGFPLSTKDLSNIRLNVFDHTVPSPPQARQSSSTS